MELSSSILAGIIQGLTEFLPVSSSGHLALWQAVTGAAEDPVAFEVLLHLGTLITVICVYRQDFVGIVTSFFRLLGKLFRGSFRFSELKEDERLTVFLFIDTLFLAPGAIISNLVTPYVLGSTVFVGLLLLLNGGLLFCTDFLKGNGKCVEGMTLRDGVKVGVAQFLAILPGVSRSGMTITAGRYVGLTAAESVRYSFLLSIPAIAGACVWKLPKLFSDAADLRTLFIYFIGTVCAALVGLCAMKLLQKIAEKRGFRGFAVYCFAAGTAAILYGILK